MNTFKRLILTGTIVLTSQTAIAAQSNGSDEADARLAIARRNMYAASIAFDDLVEARLPSKQSDHSDALLDQLLVDIWVARGVLPPSAILQRLAQDTSSADHVHNLLILATTEETSGNVGQAAGYYSAVLNTAAHTVDQRFSATLGLARLKLGTEAAAAVTMLRAIDPATVPAARQWELDLQLARALSMTEPANHDGLEAQLAKAWSAAPDAAFGDRAIARVASDRALVAARKGNRERLVTLLALDRSQRDANGGHEAVAAALPVCGEKGVSPNDVAVIEVLRLAPPERPAIGLVWASRADIGALFVAAATRTGQLTVTNGAVAQYALRCRSAPSSKYTVAVKLDEVIGGWMTGKGAYPLLNDSSARNVTQLAALLADRSTRYGATSIMRLPILLRLMECAFPQMATDDQSRIRIKDLVRQISEVLDANGAPDDLKVLWRISAIGLSIAIKDKSPSQAQSEAQALLMEAANNRAVSRDLLYNFAIGIGQQSDTPSEFKEAILSATLRLFDREPAEDPRARALALQLYALRAENGNPTGARAILKGRNLPADLCVLATPPARYISSNIRGEDYPSDVIHADMVGVTPSEFDLDTSGQALNGRLLVTDPPFVFDEVALHGIKTIRYDPPRRDGKPYGCRGATQTIRWQIPY